MFRGLHRVPRLSENSEAGRASEKMDSGARLANVTELSLKG